MIRMLSKSLITAAAAVSVFAAGSASAASTMNIAYLSTSGLTETTNLTSAFLTGGMQFQNLDAGTSFEAFCVEILQSRPNAADGLQTYTVTSFSGTQATLLQGLYSSSYASLQTARDRAAFQTAVWEITQDAEGVANAGKTASLAGAGVLDVLASSSTKGNFYFGFLGTLATTNAADNAAFAQQTNSYLAAALAYNGPDMYALSYLRNDRFQDLVAASAMPVPEPESYALMLAGLGVVGMLARRRRSER